MLAGQLAIQGKLNEAYAMAKLRNPSYSLRAFSKKLGVGVSAVSEIMNGKRRISKKLAEKILTGLALPPDELSSVLGTFDGPSEKNALTSREAMNSLEIKMDCYKVIAEWYHFAILSLAETEDFLDDFGWIAKRLGLKTIEVQQAMERLERLGMLARHKDGKRFATGQSYAAPDEVASAALKRAHADNLELARKSLEENEIFQRDFIAMTMAIDPEKLTVGKQMLREFRDRFTAYMESGRKKEVYKLCIQLLPLTKLKEKEGGA